VELEVSLSLSLSLFLSVTNVDHAVKIRLLDLFL